MISAIQIMTNLNQYLNGAGHISSKYDCGIINHYTKQKTHNCGKFSYSKQR